MLPIINDSVNVKKTKLIQNKQNFKCLNQFQILLPLITNEIKESRSNKTQEILYRIEINSKLLYLECTVIKIQSMIRKYLAIKRVERLKYRIQLFLLLTEDYKNRMIEEVILQTSLEISINFIKCHQRYNNIKATVNNEIDIFINELINEYLIETFKNIVDETISEAIDTLMKIRYSSYICDTMIYII